MPDYSLGDVARILKVSPRRLRYWQKTELLSTIETDSHEPVIGSDVELEVEGAVDDAAGDSTLALILETAAGVPILSADSD